MAKEKKSIPWCFVLSEVRYVKRLGISDKIVVNDIIVSWHTEREMKKNNQIKHKFCENGIASMDDMPNI